LISLDGKILVALPNITQGVFSKALVFVQQSDSNGTVGFILNKRFPPNKAKYIASQLNIDEWNRVYYGGPVATNTGFVLHSEDYRNDDTVQVLDNIWFTPGGSIIEDMKNGIKPKEYMLILGHSSWAPGQLDAEMIGAPPYESSSWVTADPDASMFYGRQDAIRSWDFAIRQTARERSSHILDN
tara:strand:- start:190 stop:741 length:552 start_codon:yes stop_codon:yes gene_type:complete